MSIGMDLKIFILCTLTQLVHTKSVNLGVVNDHEGVRKVYEGVIKASGTLLLKTVKTMAFEYPGDEKIRGIAVKDLDNGAAQPAINRGGLGYNFVNLKFKSERGSGFRFLVEIYM
ncbi:uncharacterized protein LOC113521526 [Galleria mellonella]|uniref:Uncharacterized protein LOC113521526 n=1 Tax=Galleria mellonella TaxID=7137 RepID=A0A6J1X7N7_GALME|nr:uncharacterized protein LOC113521526 [Galleria mellonella]